MKILACTTSIALLALGISGWAAEAQRRPLLLRPRVPQSSGVEKAAARTPAERDRLVAECEMPDRPKPAPEAAIKAVSQLCGKAISKPRPAYPAGAKEAKASGLVQVNVVTDEEGRVIWAEAVSGHSLLREASRKAACRARYSPTLISGRPVRTQTAITYNFVLQ
jgi:TonB family protein